MKKYRLDVIVREFLIESKGATQVDQRYARYLQIAISGLRNLYKDNNGIIKVARFDIDTATMIATLPNDYIDYKKIFICCKGQQIALGLNENMCPPKHDECGDLEVPSASSDSSEGPLFFFDSAVSTNTNGQFVGGLFGVGGGNNTVGYFKVFEEEGYIAIQRFSGEADEIIMEYLADLDQVDGQIYVHPYDQEALKAYISWIEKSNDRNISFGEKKDARDWYFVLKKQARQRHNMITPTELLQAWNSGYKSSPDI